MNGGPISIGSKTQALTVQSTVEVELMTAIGFGEGAIYLSNVRMELNP